MANTIKELVLDTTMLIGVGICPKSLSSPYLEIVKDFPVWQATSGYKFFDTAKSPGVYDFSFKNKFLAQKPSHIINRVGCLLWRFQWSGWLSKVPFCQRWNYLEHWMRQLLTPEPWAIDVVNEIFSYKGKVFNKFEAILGSDWIYKLFALTQEICPNSKLFICQNFLRNDLVWAGVAQEVLNLKNRGINAHVSLQAHSTIQGAMNYSKVLEKRLNELHKLNCGIDIHISEAACWIWRWNKGRVSPALKPFLKSMQQKAYLSWMKIAERNRVELFTFWAPIDELSWKLYYPDQLGIFDSNLKWCN